MTRLTAGPGHLFGITNLPYGVYRRPGGVPRIATRYGDYVVDLGLLLGTDGDDQVFEEPILNGFMAQGYERWVSIRARITEAIQADVAPQAIHGIGEVELLLPFEIADYVDFYASENHASNLGRLIRPDSPNPLPPNWKHLPVGYHGRAASIVVSGTDITRPLGQRKEPQDAEPVFGPSTRLDIEAELGFVVGTGSPMGEHIPANRAERHIFGLFLLNDWSARDIQAWEYVPLGPNLAKSFASTISPWVVPLIALDAARIATPRQEPAVLPYLRMSGAGGEGPWGLDVDLEVVWNGEVVSRPPYKTMYWSPAQMLAHETVNGAPSRTGDVFASGTVSGPEKEQRGAFIELTWAGAEPITVNGQRRTFLEDGDEVTLTATAPGANGTRIGFGEATGRIVPARSRSAEQLVDMEIALDAKRVPMSTATLRRWLFRRLWR